MPTIGSVTKTIRFNPADLGIIEDIMRKEDTTFNNAVHLLISDGVHPKKSENMSSGTPENDKKTSDAGTPLPKTDLQEIESMASLMFVSTEKLISDIRDMLEEGTLYYSNGKLTNPRYDEFERLCEAKKKDPDKMIDSLVRQLGG